MEPNGMIQAIVAGGVTSLALQVAATALAGYVAGCCLDPQSAVPLWYAMVSSPFGALVTLIPGFITGWFFPARGILPGMLAGLLGNAIYSAAFLTMWPSIAEGGLLPVAEMVLRLL